MLQQRNLVVAGVLLADMEQAANEQAIDEQATDDMLLISVCWLGSLCSVWYRSFYSTCITIVNCMTCFKALSTAWSCVGWLYWRCVGAGDASGVAPTCSVYDWCYCQPASMGL